MQIGIIGSGAVGAFLGAVLSKAREDVLLFDINKEHIEAINHNGLEIRLYDRSDTLITENITNITAISDPASLYPCQIVIVLTKTFSTRQAIQDAKLMFDENTFVLSLQNGLDNDALLLEYFPSFRVGCGYINIKSDVIAPGVIEAHINEDPCIFFRCIEGTVNSTLKSLEQVFALTPTKAEYTNDTARMIWTKVIMNVATSFTCALTLLPASQINCIAAGRELFSVLIREAIAVANASGMNFNAEEQVRIFIEETANSRENFPADARAMFNGQQTEVESLNGAIGRIGKRYGINTPANDMISNIVRVIQQSNGIN